MWFHSIKYIHKLCYHHYHASREHFYLHKLKLSPIKQLPILLSCQPLVPPFYFLQPNVLPLNYTPYSTSCFYEFGYTWYAMKEELYSICHFLTGISLAYHPDYSMFYCMSEFPSFLRLKRVSLYIFTTFCLTFHPLMDTYGLLPHLATHRE